MMQSRFAKWMAALFLVLLVNTAYLAAYASPTIFYMSNVLLHLGLGLVLSAGLVWWLVRSPEIRRGLPLAAALFLLALLAGLYLVWRGNVLANRWAFWAHVAAAGLGVAALAPWVWRKANQDGGGWRQFRAYFAVAVALLVLWPAAMAGWRKANPNPSQRIKNPLIVPTSMNEEGGGPQSPFFPSSAKTNTGGIIPSNFFMDSEACGECHKDIYEQWNSSAHHFASFNNQFYRKSIEYMQDVVGTAAEQVVRRLPRSRGLLQRPFRAADQRADRHAGGARRPGLHLLPLDRARAQLDGQRRLHHRISAAARDATSENKVRPGARPFPDLYSIRSRTSSTFMKPFMRRTRRSSAPPATRSTSTFRSTTTAGSAASTTTTTGRPAAFRARARGRSTIRRRPRTALDCHMPLVDSQDPGNTGRQGALAPLPGGEHGARPSSTRTRSR